MRNLWSFSPEQRKAAFRSGQFAMDTNSPQGVGLIGWWPLGVHPGDADDLDYSGNKNHGVRTNGPTRQAVVHPRWGGIHALDLDGNEYVNAGPIPSIQPENSTMTLASWTIMPATDRAAMVSYRNPANPGWVFSVSSSGQLELFADNGFRVSATATVAANEWTHVCLVSKGGSFTFYKNGIEHDTLTHTVGAGTGFVSFGAWDVGSGSSGQQFQDDIRIFKRTLNISEINALYREPWSLVRPLGIRTISFAPPEAVTVVGLATESDISQTTTIVATGIAGLSTESDISQAVVSSKQQAVGLVAESDISQSIIPQRIVSVGLATESDIVQTATPQRTRTVGLVTESDISQAVTFLQAHLVSLATESDDAFAISALKVVAVAVTIESDISQAVTIFAFAFIPVGVVKGEVFIIGVQQGELAGKS